jgi:hypothetical protein
MKKTIILFLILLALSILMGCNVNLKIPDDTDNPAKPEAGQTTEEETNKSKIEPDQPEFSNLTEIEEPVYFTLRGLYSDGGWVDANEEDIESDYYFYVIPSGTALAGMSGEEYFIWWDTDAFYFGDVESPYSLENNGTVLKVRELYGHVGTVIFEFVKTDEIPEHITDSYKDFNFYFGNIGYLGELYPAVFGDWDNLALDDYNEFAGYLFEVLYDEGREYLDMGMSVLVTGETEEISDFPVCMIVMVGTSHEEHFVREIYYAVTPEGGVFRLEPIMGEWELVFVFGAVG